MPFITRDELPAGATTQTFGSLTPGHFYGPSLDPAQAYQVRLPGLVIRAAGGEGFRAIDAAPLGGAGVALAVGADGDGLFVHIPGGCGVLGLEVGGAAFVHIRLGPPDGPPFPQVRTPAGPGTTFVGYAADGARRVQSVLLLDLTLDGVPVWLDSVTLA